MGTYALGCLDEVGVMVVFWSMHLWPQYPLLAADVACVFENLPHDKINYSVQLQTFTVKYVRKFKTVVQLLCPAVVFMLDNQ